MLVRAVDVSHPHPGAVRNRAAINCQGSVTPQGSYSNIRPWPYMGLSQCCVTGGVTTYSAASQQPSSAVPQFPLCTVG